MSKKGKNICKRKDGRWEGRYIRFMTQKEKPNMDTFMGKLIQK